MKTYNAYQEAKIANPEMEVYKLAAGFIATNEPQGVSVHKCNPADYCMTVEKFLANGHKFVEGDCYLNSNVVSIGLVNIPWVNNNPSALDSKLFILRAAALESQMNIDNLATQTPEEKEALDLIDTTPHQYEMGKFSGKLRTKGEYVKCEYGDKVSNIVMDFENNEPLYKMVNDEYWSVDELDDLFGLILDGGEHIYRRIETPMTERDAFINEAMSVVKLSHLVVISDAIGELFDSGKFKLVESN